MVTLDSLSDQVSTLAKLVQAQNKVLAEQNKILRLLRPASPSAPVSQTIEDDIPGTYRSGPGASVRIDGAVWSITADGKVAKDGQPATTPDLTANVVRIGRDAKGRPAHVNAAGELRHFVGQPDWPLSAPVVSIVV